MTNYWITTNNTKIKHVLKFVLGDLISSWRETTDSSFDRFFMCRNRMCDRVIYRLVATIGFREVKEFVKVGVKTCNVWGMGNLPNSWGPAFSIILSAITATDSTDCDLSVFAKTGCMYDGRFSECNSFQNSVSNDSSVHALSSF